MAKESTAKESTAKESTAKESTVLFCTETETVRMMLYKYRSILLLVILYLSTLCYFFLINKKIKMKTYAQNNLNVETSLQAKTLKLKNYSEKIKLLCSLAKNNASFRNQILVKARDNYPYSDPRPRTPLYGNGVLRSVHSVPERGSTGQGTDAVGVTEERSRRLLFSLKTKTPLVRISRRLHRHIKSVFKFNSSLRTPLSPYGVQVQVPVQRGGQGAYAWNGGEVSNNNTIVYNFNSNFKKFKLTSIIENSFFSMNRLISKPVLNIKPNKVIIHLFYYVSPFVKDTAVRRHTPSPYGLLLPNCTSDAYAPHGCSHPSVGTPILPGDASIHPIRCSNPGDAYASIGWTRQPGNGDAYAPGWLASVGTAGGTEQAGFKLANLFNSKSIQLQALCAFLSKNLKKPVEFELIRLHHPSLESSILANTIGYIAQNTRKTFRVIMLKLFKSTKIKKFNEFKYIFNIKNFKPTALVGIRIKLGGRLLSQRIVPRFTSKTIQRGNLGKTKADLITTSRFTQKNKRGVFSFTVTMGHKFF